MSPRIWLKIDLNVKHFLRISGDFVTNLMKINSSLQIKTTMIETRLNSIPFLISIVRELMHWNHSTAS